MSNEDNKNEQPKAESATDHWINHLDKSQDENQKWNNLQKEWIEDLKTNPRYKTFYERFNPSSIDSFIQHYATYKHLWLRYGGMYKDQVEKRELRYRKAAADCLWEIQQKKLFNLQCQWRAEQIKIDGVEVSFDFKYWERHIQQCNFIEPITQDEVDLYTQYLLGTDYSKIGWLQGWQDYEDYKQEYIKGGDAISMPEWYMFYDLRKGTGSLMLLPDVRGEKEEFYMDLCRKKRKKEWDEKIAADPQKYPKPDSRPFLNYYGNKSLIPEFIKLFDDKKVLELYNAYTAANENVFDDDEEMDEVFRKIKEVKDFIPIAAHYNWREALKSAWYNYEQRKTAASLPAAFDEYVFRNTMKIAHETKGDIFYREHSDAIKQMIIEGRILNGEPKNLNF